MDIDTLISELAADVPPVRAHAVPRRLALGIGLGVLVALALIVWALGVNPQLAAALTMHGFWVKWGYSLSVSAIALVLVARLARPDGAPPRHLALWLAVPVLVLAAVGAVELARAPASHWLAMWLGETWMICPWLVLALAMPIFIGLLWSFRRMAPTRLRAAGAAAGLAAGAIAATLYCIHCPEMSAIFVLTWYTMGIGLAAGMGAALGPRVLRW